MDVKEVRRKKAILELKLDELVGSFEVDTNTRVGSVNITRNGTNIAHNVVVTVVV